MKNYTEKSTSIDQKANILLVDDRPENLLALESVLASPSYHLISATSGEDALKHVLTEDFAVILLDVQMPGLDGFETAKLIKSRKKSEQTPIIFITAINQAIDHVKQGYNAGAIDYIFKPFHPETLKLKVEAFVKIHNYQEQIKFQSEVMKVIGETLSDTLITFNDKGMIQSANPTIIEMFGYTEKELIGNDIDKLVPNLFVNFFNQEESGKIIETIALRKDQSEFPADIQIGKASIEENRIYVCSIRDVTERKLMEEERFRKIFEATPCLVSLRSLQDWRYINVNKSWLTYSGYNDYEDIINQTSDFLKYILHSEEIGETVVEMAELEHPIQNERVSYLNKTGDLREGLLSTEVMELHGEKCLLSVITDITERVFMEKEMTRLDSLNLVGEMAAGIVHEVRNPLTTIRGFLQMAKDFPSEEHIDIMIEELDRAHNIITEFLTVSKTNPAKHRLKKLDDIIETLFPLIQAKAMYANKYIRLDLGQCPPLSLNEKEIRQLILNLSINGLEAMSAGGMLTIKTYCSDHEVILEVEDQGCGIKEEFIDQIGTPFFSTKVQGTGLGLSVCHSVVSRHNAKLDVRTSDQGTIFFVNFPLQEQVVKS
ncbi:response regulator [Bacillus taeanensis]|uniref:histidine kinase n=1 Tax=Bacillus taeanensis TaxID=273032 RepID=A0A366XY16_9BACI|nr:response regulator [Bacillus taeanensis]RBW69659.1 hybrid sensor histidine kinase/response regulator [Bacillus taeanensis]